MPPKSFEFEVRALRMLTPTVFELKLRPTETLDYQAGQFVSLVIPGAGPNGRDLRRAYSVASHPGQETFDLCIKRVEGGPGTEYLYRSQPGLKIKAFAPYGIFVFKTPPERKVCMIATGTGISPFRSMVFDASFKNRKEGSSSLLFGCSHESEILYADEMKKVPHLDWIPCVSRPSAEYKGRSCRVTHLLAEMSVEECQNTDFYMCGNGAMIEEVKKILTEKGVPKTSIHQEIYYRPKAEKAETVTDAS